MYSIYEQLLQKHGVTNYRVSKETGIAQSVLSAWKNGVSTPKQDKLQKIADFFGVSLEYLMTGEEPSGIDMDSIAYDEIEKNLLLHFRNADLTKEQKAALAKMLCSNVDVYIDFLKDNKK